MTRIAGGAFLALFSAVTFANEFDSRQFDLDGLIHVDVPQVVTPAKVKQPRVEVSSTLSVLDGEFIRHSNIQYVEDLLFFVPGFFVGPYANSYQKVAAFHGTEVDRFRRIQVLVNGRSVYSSAYARVDWTSLAINVEDIERVEVNRGPNASSYGSNSFLAVVNIITRSPLDTLGSSLHGFAMDNGESRLYGQHSGLFGDWSYRASASRGKVLGADRDAQGNNRNDGHRRITGSALLVYESAAQKVDIDFGASRLEAQTTHIDLPGVLYPEREPEFEYSREHFKLGWEVEHTSHHTLTGKYYYDHSIQEETHDIAAPGLLLGQLLESQFGAFSFYSGQIVGALEETRQHLELQSTWTPTVNSRLVNTLSYRQDDAYSKTFFDRSYREELARLSSNINYRGYDPLIINAGLMWEHSRLSGEYLSPQLGATFKLSSQSSVRANVSQAYRTPDIYDQKARWSYVFNGVRSIPAIATGEKAEKITSYEVGVYRNIPALGLSYDLSVYREELVDLVPSVKKYYEAIADGGLISSGETYQATIKGIEFEADWRTRTGVQFRATAAFQDTDTQSDALAATVTPFVATVFARVPVTNHVFFNSRYIYGQELAGYDFNYLSLWVAHQLRIGEYALTSGAGGSWRLDNNPYLYADNVSTDRSSYYLYANFTF